MVIIGVNPDRGGDISIWRNGEIVSFSIPEKIEDIKKHIYYSMEDIYCYMPVWKPTNWQTPKTAGELMLNIGFLKGLFQGLNYKIKYFSKNKLLKHFNIVVNKSITSKNKRDTDLKNQIKSVAKSSFPKQKISHSNSNSLIILQYALMDLKLC